MKMHYLKARRGYKHLPVRANRLLAFVAAMFFRKTGDLDTPDYMPGGRFLDFGCGSGDVVAFARFVGWTAEGIEIDAAAAAAGRQAGLDIIHGSVEALEALPGRYDYIFSSHCIEHVPDAGRLFRAFHLALKPGGRLAVDVPNANSAAVDCFGAYYYYLGMPIHVHLFTPRSISILAERCGLEGAEVVTHSRWITQAESALLRMRGGAGRFHRHGSAAGVLGRLAAIPAAVASWQHGKGDCLVLNCRKPSGLLGRHRKAGTRKAAGER
jgi:SAM-dependent methyltransferase